MHKFFLECDLSAAEGRIVYALTHAPHLIEIARSLPSQYDMHGENTALFFGPQWTKPQRQIGKKIVHGTHYDEGGQRIADDIMKESESAVIIPAAECTRLQGIYLEKRPEIRAVYQGNIRRRIMGGEALTNSWGARADFSPMWRAAGLAYQKLEVLRSGYAWVPQGEIGRLLNRCGFIPLHKWLCAGNCPNTRINLQVHDSLVVSTTLVDVWDVAKFLQESLTVVREYEGVPLSIPVEFAVGLRSWKKDMEWKALPGRADFEGEIEARLPT
jgi:DNA polymerase I-like protein with 3'-5' exonuclease and polymerase domains